jgi:hypothetical protein
VLLHLAKPLPSTGIRKWRSALRKKILYIRLQRSGTAAWCRFVTRVQSTHLKATELPSPLTSARLKETVYLYGFGSFPVPVAGAWSDRKRPSHGRRSRISHLISEAPTTALPADDAYGGNCRVLSHLLAPAVAASRPQRPALVVVAHAAGSWPESPPNWLKESS